jgi:hypothetical protein
VRSHWFCHLAMLWSLTCSTISFLWTTSVDVSYEIVVGVYNDVANCQH